MIYRPLVGFFFSANHRRTGMKRSIWYVWLFYNSNSSCRATFLGICSPLNELFRSSEGEKRKVTEKDIRQSNEPWCERRATALLTVAFFITVPKKRRRNNGATRFDLKQRFFHHPVVKRFPVWREIHQPREITGEKKRSSCLECFSRERKKDGGIQSNVSFSWRPLEKIDHLLSGIYTNPLSWTLKSR